MPTSTYEGFDVTYRDPAGVLQPVPSVTIKVYDATHVASLSDLTADVAGHVAAGTLSVDAGTVVRFRVESYLGMAGVLEQVTT